jgi:FkbM family methyltransferase
MTAGERRRFPIPKRVVRRVGWMARRVARLFLPRRLRSELRALPAYPSTRALVSDWHSFWALRQLENPGRGVGSQATVEVRFRELGGAPVKLRPGTQDDSLATDVFLKRHHLPPETFDATRPSTILDLGANVGITMAHIATLYPLARVVGVELDDANAALCGENVSAWQERCEVIRAAIWVDDGTVNYELDERSEQSYHVEDAVPERGKPESVVAARASAPAISLPTLIARTGAEWIDYVKMDIEGAERRVLKENTGWASRVRSIKVEVHPPYSVEECMEDLARLGFTPTPIPKRRGGVTGIRAS